MFAIQGPTRLLFLKKCLLEKFLRFVAKIILLLSEGQVLRFIFGNGLTGSFVAQGIKFCVMGGQQL